MKSVKIKEFAANVHFLFSYFLQKRQIIQTLGLNFEYDGLSEVMLTDSALEIPAFFSEK